MQKFEVRPRFDLELDVPPEVLEAALKAAVAGDTSSWARLPYAEFGVPSAERRTWSPRLAVYVHAPDPDAPRTEGELRLRCRFQPEPGVWTFYMAMAAALLVCGSVAVAWICASFILGWSLVGPFFAVGVAALLGAALYGASQLGQKMAADQMGGLAERLWLALCDAKARAEGHAPLRVEPGTAATQS